MDYKTYFNSCWPNEGVGYLKAGVFYPLENTATDKLHAFAVDPAFMLEEPDQLLHSHPTGYEIQDPTYDPHSPSHTDLECQIATAIEWGICVTDGTTCEDPLWWGNPDNRPELLGRDFIYNIQDCYALCQDWFYANRGVVLPNYARTPYWDEEGHDYIEQHLEDCGFMKIDLAELRSGDVLCYRIRSQTVRHIGIFLGNNEVLSHWFGRVSCVEQYGTWASKIAFAARYQA